MVTKGNNLSSRPAVANQGDIFIDLSNSKEYVFSFGSWYDTSSTAVPYVKPTDIATSSKLGISKIGDGLTITTAGKLSATPELPTVEVADAGKVLTVSAEGKWAAAALPEEE